MACLIGWYKIGKQIHLQLRPRHRSKRVTLTIEPNLHRIYQAHLSKQCAHVVIGNANQIKVRIACVYEVLDVCVVVSACKYRWLFDFHP